MLASKLDQPEKKSEKKLLFTDSDQYVIPAVQSWNEGYSQANKFLYIQESNTQNKSLAKGR